MNYPINVQIKISRNLINNYLNNYDNYLDRILNISLDDQENNEPQKNLIGKEENTENLVIKDSNFLNVCSESSKLKCAICGLCVLDGGLCVLDGGLCVLDGGLSGSENVIELNCGHIFHKGCIYEWLRYGDSCPLCRVKQSVCVLEGDGGCPCSCPSLPPSQSLPPSECVELCSVSVPVSSSQVSSSQVSSSQVSSSQVSSSQVSSSQVSIPVSSSSSGLSSSDISVSSPGFSSCELSNNFSSISLGGSPPPEPVNGNMIIIRLPNRCIYRRRFNNKDRVGDLLNFIKKIWREDNIDLSNIKLRNRNGLLCDYNHSLEEEGIVNGTTLSVVKR